MRELINQLAFILGFAIVAIFIFSYDAYCNEGEKSVVGLIYNIRAGVKVALLLDDNTIIPVKNNEDTESLIVKDKVNFYYKVKKIEPVKVGSLRYYELITPQVVSL